jgi:hypothetical protein
LAIGVWAPLVRNKNGGRILLLLSVIMLLVGGGFGPPIIGILAGVAGTRIGAPLTWWRKRLSVNVRRFLAKLWPWIFGITVINGVFLVIGSLILVYFFDLNNYPHHPTPTATHALTSTPTCAITLTSSQ